MWEVRFVAMIDYMILWHCASNQSWAFQTTHLLTWFMSRPLRFNASRETVHLDEDLLASCYRCQLLTHTPTQCQARSHLTRCCVKYFNQSFGCFNLFGEFDLLLLQIRPLWLPQCLLITSIGKYWTNLFGLVQCKNRCWPTCWKHLQTMTWMLL